MEGGAVDVGSWRETMVLKYRPVGLIGRSRSRTNGRNGGLQFQAHARGPATLLGGVFGRAVAGEEWSVPAPITCVR